MSTQVPATATVAPSHRTRRPTRCPKAASAALSTSDTSSRKPRPSTSPNDDRRVRRAARCRSSPVRTERARCGRAHSAAPRTLSWRRSQRTTTLITVAMAPLPGALALAINPCTASAPSFPRSPPSWVASSPRTASCPKKKPGHRDDDDQQRRNREYRVVRECCSHAGGVVIDPCRHRFPDQLPQGIEIHAHLSMLGGHIRWRILHGSCNAVCAPINALEQR